MTAATAPAHIFDSTDSQPVPYAMTLGNLRTWYRLGIDHARADLLPEVDVRRAGYRAMRECLAYAIADRLVSGEVNGNLIALYQRVNAKCNELAAAKS